MKKPESANITVIKVDNEAPVSISELNITKIEDIKANVDNEAPVEDLDQKEEPGQNEPDEKQVAKKTVLTLIKKKIEDFVFQKVVTLEFRNESIDPPEAFS